MIGYRCNMCGDKISENKYNNLKEKDDLTCLECGKGVYESYFIDDEKTNENNYDYDYNYNHREHKTETTNSEGISGKIKSMIKKGNELPGATQKNRIIGGVTGLIGGTIILGFIPVLGTVVGAVAGYMFAPYFVPKMIKFFKKLKDDLTKDKYDR